MSASEPVSVQFRKHCRGNISALKNAVFNFVSDSNLFGALNYEEKMNVFLLVVPHSSKKSPVRL